MTTIQVIGSGRREEYTLQVLLSEGRWATIVTNQATMIMLEERFKKPEGDFPFTYISTPAELQNTPKDRIIRIKNLRPHNGPERDDCFRLD